MTGEAGAVATPRVVSFDWYTSLDRGGRRAFWSSLSGWALDSYDYQIYSFALTAIAATFNLSRGQSGLIATVTLLVSAFGGMLAGVLADRIGRVPTLIATIACYSVFTFLSGFSQSFGELLVFRALQGFGFGGEWAAGAILVAEVANPAQRGRTLGWIQSAWALGWALANLAYIVVFSLDPSGHSWRWLFWLGILPALLVLYVRSRVSEPRVFSQTRKAVRAGRVGSAVPLFQIFDPVLIRTTLPAVLLATGAQGGYYSIFTWLPTYLLTAKHFSVNGTGAYLFIVIGGAFAGYVLAAYLNDWLGRRGTFVVYAALSAAMILAFALLPADVLRPVLPVVSFVLGFAASGIFSGFGSYLAELYPSRVRGAGQGFCYNTGRGLGALFPLAIGVLSTRFGLGGAIAFGAVGYGLCALSLLFLPETRGKVLVAED